MTNRMCFHWALPLALCLLFAPQSWTQTPVAKDRHIVIISLDGFASYALQNPLLPLPTLRRLIQEGAVAESMLVVNPAVTWPNHTSMVTGVVLATHGVLYNGLAVRGGEGKPLRVDPWIDKAELVHAPTLYDAAQTAGLSTAEVDWVAVQNTPAISWSFAERPRAVGKIEREMLEAGFVSENDLRDFAKAPILWRDEIWTRAAVHILERHRPNLLLFHLLTTDSAQHRYGADSLAGNSALALADRQVQRILDAVRVAGI
jgi:predicted AlkP superfamily pyrophosphatase or phosphodiesterase